MSGSCVIVSWFLLLFIGIIAVTMEQFIHLTKLKILSKKARPPLRSILAAPFQDSTRVRLNEIKQREQFRPIAPVCLEEEAARWFGCDYASPYMLYTHRVRTDALAAVTHVNGTARIQTVSVATNRKLYELLSAFKARTGYGVLCNTSLNFKGRGFINKIDDLSAYVAEHKMDGFVVEEKAYFLKSSTSYQGYLRMPNSIAAVRSRIHA